MVNEKRKQAFLKEYKALCLKYEIYVGACGCCESPWVVDGRDTHLLEEYQLDDLKDNFKHLGME